MSSRNHLRKESSPFSAALAAVELDCRPKPRNLPGYVKNNSERWIHCRIEQHIDITVTNNIMEKRIYATPNNLYIKINPAAMETDINVNRTGFVDFLILLRSNYFLPNFTIKDKIPYNRYKTDLFSIFF